MNEHAAKAAAFLRLHSQDHPLLLANAWDRGSARLLVSLGYEALATTSSGYAATLGRLDYSLSRAEAVAHAADLAAAVDVPVSADFEDCFAKDAAGVAETVHMALDVGLAGCSIEDWSSADEHLYSMEAAAERVAAAAQAAHSGSVHLVLTARAENHLRGNPNLEDTIARLRAYQDAGADVLYAPGLIRAEDIRAVGEAVDLPVNVLARPGMPPVVELAELGVKRVSVGGSFAFAGFGAVADAAQELLTSGTYGFMGIATTGSKAARSAFSD